MSTFKTGLVQLKIHFTHRLCMYSTLINFSDANKQWEASHLGENRLWFFKTLTLAVPRGHHSLSFIFSSVKRWFNASPPLNWVWKVISLFPPIYLTSRWIFHASHHALSFLTDVWLSALHPGWLTLDFVRLNLDAPVSRRHCRGI